MVGTPLRTPHTPSQHGVQLNNRYLNKVHPYRYNEVPHARTPLVPNLKVGSERKLRKKGETRAVGTHNEIILLFDEVPIKVGHFDIGDEHVGWETVENFVANELFRNVTRALGGRERHVDARRQIRKQFQGIEIKYMNGHGMYAPSHVRSSFGQFNELAGYQYLSPSGYIVASHDTHHYKRKVRNKKGKYKTYSKKLLTIWFIPITDTNNWYYMYSNNLTIRATRDPDYINVRNEDEQFYRKTDETEQGSPFDIHKINDNKNSFRSYKPVSPNTPPPYNARTPESVKRKSRKK